MNHRWINNKCSKCGVERQKKEFKRWQRSETILVNGVWQDRNIHTYGTAWHYGEQYKFERPDCVTDDSSMLFHECPNCNWRCNCDTQPCSCCNE